MKPRRADVAGRRVGDGQSKSDRNRGVDRIASVLQDLDEAPDLESTPDTGPEIVALLPSRLEELTAEKSAEAAAG